MKVRSLMKTGAAILFSVSLATVASAQATRTWVSGVGDDVNPCSRTAPCKTFAGAISKTASGGEIDALDPGGFGAVTITKPITIDGGMGQVASVLSSGVQGIIINVTSPANGAVYLRNLEINGAGTTLGTNGVHIVAAGFVTMEHVSISNYSARAVLYDGTVAVQILLNDCRLTQIQATAFAVLPSAGNPAVNVEINHTVISQNGIAAGTAGGFFGQNGCRALIRDSAITHNTASGVEAGANCTILVDNSDLSFNVSGAKTSGGTLLLSRSTIIGSSGTAVNNAGGTLNTFGDNRMAANAGGNNTGTAAAPGLQ
jgi:hypothetical protein